MAARATHPTTALPEQDQLASERSVRLVAVSRDGHETAWTVGWARWHPTVADLILALGLEGTEVQINGERWVADELLDAIDLFDGSLIAEAARGDDVTAARGDDVTVPEAVPEGVAAGAFREPNALISLAQIGGLTAGGTVEIGAGMVMAKHDQVASGSCEVGVPLGVGDRRRSDGSGTMLELMVPSGETGRDVVVLEGDVFAVERSSRTSVPTQSLRGRRAHLVHRQPRVKPAYEVARASIPEETPEPSKPAAFSWVIMLAPLPIGILIAILFRPYFLLFTMMGPAMAGARWFEGRRRYRKSMMQWRTDEQRLNRLFAGEVAAVAHAETTWRRSEHPTLAELIRRAESGSALLWERRPDHDDFLTLCLGYHDVEWLAAEEPHEHGGVTLPVVPLGVRLGPDVAVGVVGPEEACRSVARSLVVQAVTLHGPADVQVDVEFSRAGRSRSDVWDWCKWLPHCTERQRFDDEPSSAEDRPGTTLLTVVDLLGSSARASSRQPSGRAAIILADRIEDLPARCSAVAVCGATTDKTTQRMDGPRVDFLDLDQGLRINGVYPIGCATRTSERLARSLAPLRDPDEAEHLAVAESEVALADLIDDLSPDSIAARWSCHDPGSLVATMGLASDTFDVDLVADGPHALVAGPTGSGKSELLRTLVVSLSVAYPPSSCAFVLVDFKGGGAFDVLAPLPHVAAVVTDLDDGVAERALRSLRAELRLREERLRECGVYDLADFHSAGHSGLARLVLVVDEFATLAAELPDFLSGLVDIAQRGRSLGVHLVLATQRPAGVLDNKIRANTNLRICLRVQDASESRDVVGVVDAAAIPTSRPGRAIVRIGPDPVRSVQCAHIGPGTPQSAPGVLSAARFVRVPTDELAGSDIGQPGTPCPDLIETVVEAANLLGMHRAPAPWLAALSPDVDVAQVWSSCWVQRDRVPIGREDRPDTKSQPLLFWDRGDGPLAVVGGSAPERFDLVEMFTHSVGCEPLGSPAKGGVAEPLELYVIGGRDASVASNHSGVIDPDDLERVSRVLDRCSNLKRGVVGESRALVIVNGYERVGMSAEPKVRAAVIDRVNQLIADSDPTVAVVVMTATERGIPLRVLSGVSQRVVLALSDKSGYATFGVRARDVPPLGQRAGICPDTGHLVQLFGLGGSTAAAQSWTKSVPSAPDQLRLVDLHASRERQVPTQSDPEMDGSISLPIGIDLSSLNVASLDLSSGTALIVGGAGSGRTTALETIARAFRHLYPDASIVAILGTVAANGALAARAPIDHVMLPDASSIDELQLGSGDLLVVDDAGAVSAELGVLISELHRTRHAPRIVVAGRAEDFRSLRLWCGSLRDARAGLVLSADRTDSDVLRQPLRGYPGITWRSGDGTLIDAGRACPVRVASG